MDVLYYIVRSKLTTRREVANMTHKEATQLLGNNISISDLEYIIETLSFMDILNNDEENKKLEACKLLLQERT